MRESGGIIIQSMLTPEAFSPAGAGKQRREENAMGVMICAALLLIAWVVFVFSKYNPDRRLTSGSVRPPRPKRRPHRWYR